MRTTGRVSEKTSLIVYLGNNVDHERGPQKGKAEMGERTSKRLLVSKLAVPPGL